jgi:hypothetical protein
VLARCAWRAGTFAYAFLDQIAVIYEFLNEDASPRRAVSVEDFHRDWCAHWPQDQR